LEKAVSDCFFEVFLILPNINRSIGLIFWLIPAKERATAISHCCGFKYFQRIFRLKRYQFFLIGKIP
jgi:hypothetical protein